MDKRRKRNDIKIALLTDTPVGDPGAERKDGLGFDVYAQVLAAAAEWTEGPFTIGVFGEWGTGKTSLMRLIKQQLDDRKSVGTVWFNVWRFEKEEHPIIPLIATIIRELQRNKHALAKLKDGGAALLRGLRAIAYGFSAKSKVKIPGFAEIEASFVAKEMIDREKELARDPLLDRSIYYEAFETLSKVSVGGKTNIVILIDDLDRCFPDQAIKLLESIKLILCQPGFVFILGMARSLIEGFLQYRYRTQYGISNYAGREYLDKIVQLGFHIPPHQERMGEFLKSILKYVGGDEEEILAKILPIISVACEGNPRTTIRFVNNLLIDRGINLALADKKLMRKIPIGYFAVSRTLQQRWPDLFEILETSDDLCKKMEDWKLKGPDIYETKDQNEKNLARMIMSETDFRKLLYSDEGMAWLQNYAIRREATRFLRIQRPSTDDQFKEVVKADSVAYRGERLDQMLSILEGRQKDTEKEIDETRKE